jgi:signal transduction histidine kinase
VTSLRRPLWIFGLLLLLPAGASAALGWRSLARERDARRADAVREAQAVAERTALAEADSLEALRRREEERPYFHYARQFQPADLASNVAAFVPSPLASDPDDPRLLGWFQWSLFPSGHVAADTFAPAPDALETSLAGTYRPALESRLRGVAATGTLEGARIAATPLPTVAANEEQGQLLEEIEVAKSQGEGSTARLEDYRQRVQSKAGPTPSIDVRLTPFSYVARTAGDAGPPLVAYRLVWIPGRAAASQRDAPTDRWLLQGYALDPGRRLPTSWSAASDDVLVCRGDCAEGTPPAAAGFVARKSLADVLGAKLVEAPVVPGSIVTWGEHKADLLRRLDDAEAAKRLSQDASKPQSEGYGVRKGAEGLEKDRAPAAEEAPPPPRQAGADATMEDGTVALSPGPGTVGGTTLRPVDVNALQIAYLAERVPDPSLTVAAAPALSQIEESFRAARNRFFLLVLGLAAVVAVGLAALFRSVRREVAVARKKEDFVAAVTHELKTPLAGIRMYADMLQGGFYADPEAAGSYAGRIVGEAKRLDALVDRVLALAAYDRGVVAFRPVPSDLGALAREAVSAHEAAAREAGTALRVEVEEGVPALPLDPALVLPLVGNLVDNAIKYSARSATKEVAVRVRRAGPAHVALEVADRGAGIPAADRPRVFEPFYRAGGEETRTAPGVGLGLALVSRYAEAHGATVSLESEEGRGTTVSVRFPLSSPEPAKRPG